WRERVAALVHAGAEPIGVRGLRDRRVLPAIDVVQRLRSVPPTTTVEAMRAASAVSGDDPDAVMRWGQHEGVTLRWERVGEDGIYDLIVNPRWTQCGDGIAQPAAFYGRYANAPARQVDDDAF